MPEVDRDRADQGLSGEELDAERVVELPEREVLSVVDPHPGYGLLRPHPPLWVPDPVPVGPIGPVDPVET